MATCKDCLHYEACVDMLQVMGFKVDGAGFMADKKCRMFKDRSRFVELPCKIGDTVWAIRSFHGKKHPQQGIVSDMYFLSNMELQIVVKYVARGEWGKTVFATCEAAEKALAERSRNG